MKFRRTRPSFIDTLESFPVDADNVSIIEETKAFREKLISLIRSATNRIYITALYLQDDESGQEILTEIYQAKQKNPSLDVKIFVDYLRAQRGLMGYPESIGNVRLYREYAEKYEHQIEILGVPVKTREVLGVLHLKGFVFDDVLLYSGASLNNIYLQQGERYRYDRYHVFADKTLCDSFVKFLQRFIVKASAVKQLTIDNLPQKKQIKPSIKQLKKQLQVGEYTFQSQALTSTEKQVKVTPLLGFGGRKNRLNRAIVEMIRLAQEQVTIYTPYFNLPNKINKVVRKILKQGKRVNIVIGDKTANDFYIPPDQEFNKIGIVPYVYETNLRAFAKRNQRYIDAGLLNLFLWKHADNSFHLKGISVDDNTYLVTGHNLNPRACRLDLENGILIQDPQHLLQAKFKSEYEKILTHTKRISHFEDVETIKDYPEAASKLMRSVKRAKLDSILNRLL
ncbi:CDP-diacylglycerol--serine O-phosphatidyltransferase [Aliikangiella marina]|uniref:CDP-diacylglycerol--serine O-phosphatidyltransferase n=1 Tax=Aliikangiella marina TaxID=1712262 RepID=A0A545TCT2_9GAMM|nr:CDP-diacylglycerol--serine O-phosphatidyltransferase [Aliikangiella marina]TQV75001.1 CDP-diacylglycerol--serine O-phosphatidyltransferase [Aliikangiella marina]